MNAGRKLRGDFNGLFGDLLCLSHSDTAKDEHGQDVELSEGMSVVVYDEDIGDDGNRDDLFAAGVVIRSPDWLRCRGSLWSLQIDDKGVRHESDLPAAERSVLYGGDVSRD